MKTTFLALLFAASVSHAQNSGTTPAANQTTDTTTAAPIVPGSGGVTMVLNPLQLTDGKIKQEWFGDIRLRGVQAKESIDEKRLYTQLRARLGLKAEVNEDVKAVFRLMTATSSISGNQTLGDSKEPGMPRRSFGLDWGYMDWAFTPTGHAWAGRTANPFWSPNKVQINYDADLSFEGFALKWEPKILTGSENLAKSNVFANLGAFMIAENYNDVKPKTDIVDTGLAGGDLGIALKSTSWTWTSHVGNFYYFNLKDKAVGAVSTGTKMDAYGSPYEPRIYGNTAYAEDPLAATPTYYYKYGYVLVEAGTEFKHNVGPIEYTVFADWIKNTKVSQYDTAYEAGVAVKWKFVTLGFAQILKKRDAVVAAFTDSDTNGGGTDNRGTRINLQLQLAKNATLALIHHSAKRGLDSVSRDFNSTFADLQVGF